MVSMSSDFSILSDNEDLPIGWVITELENVCTVQGGYAFKSKDYTENGIPLVRISNLVENNNVDLDSNPIFLPESYRISHSNYCLREGDILIAMSGATTGKMAVFRCSLDALLNQRVGRFIIRDKTLVDKPYLSKLIENLSSKVAQKAYGGAQPNISPSEIERLLIPLPPLNEQRRIVEKVEALMARSRRAKEALDAIPKLIEQFRQSVLAAAFRGDLTADWREHNPNIEPASVLLEKLKAPQKKDKQNKLDIANEEIELLPKIPESWRWIKFGALVASIRSGSGEVPNNEKSDYPILRSSSVRSGFVDLNDIRFLSESQSSNSSNFLQDGDLLFTRLSGSIEYVANCAIVRNLSNRSIQYPDRLFCVKIIESKLLDISELWFASPFLRNIITSEAKSSAGHQRISMGAITDAWFPLIPLEECKEIVQLVRRSLNGINSLEQIYLDTSSSMNNLTQSILSKAFRGELVEQDPNDEPASVLLERIQKEREKEKTKVKQTGAKKLKK